MNSQTSKAGAEQVRARNLERSKSWILVAVVGCAALALGYVGRGWILPGGPSLSVPAEVAALMGQRQLRGATAMSRDSFAMATGQIDDEVEGLYVLDFVTGDLQCVVLNFRTAKFSAIFRANVVNDLAVDPAKKPNYLVTTGGINFPRGATLARPGRSVVYVLETSTGNYAAYGIPWRRELAATGRTQVASLLLLDVGTARTAAIRE